MDDSDRSAYAHAAAPFQAEVQRLLPAGADLLDAHTHLGVDEDGRSLTLAQLLEQLDDAGVRRACVFPLHDPDRVPGYRVPNDRVLGWAQESAGRLIPYCRLDPADDPVAEGERSIAAGARGIKLHPRAQDFVFDGPQMDGIFKLAEQADVPILIHAGRGLPPLADGLANIALRHPSVVLVLAHGAICDQGILTSRLADHPGVLYDISCFFPVDVMELLSRAPAERIVLASDPPYGLPSMSLYLALRLAAHARLDEPTTRALLGGTMASVIDGTGLPPATAPRRGPTVSMSGRLARVYGYASLAGPALFQGMANQAREALDMAIAACRDPHPDAAGAALEVITPALSTARALMEVQDGALAAIALVYYTMVRAATELPDPA
ncbi:MAG TPA: amidohydrolase family protein [Solirubrobacteraceae bacterium]|nr:amidohydrolase family protein [Solirubrobacteraceae bacterium]